MKRKKNSNFFQFNWSLVNFRKKSSCIFFVKIWIRGPGLAPIPTKSLEDRSFPFEVINFDLNRGSLNPIKEFYCIIRLFFFNQRY